MKGKDIFWSVVTLVVWYLFAYYALYAIRSSVSLGSAAFILLSLGVIGTATCPWFQHTAAWKELVGSTPRSSPPSEEKR